MHLPATTELGSDFKITDGCPFFFAKIVHQEGNQV